MIPLKKYNEFLSEQISLEELKIVDDILSNTVNEQLNINKMWNKVLSYAKKGILTFTIVLTLLSSPAFANQVNADKLIDTFNVTQVDKDTNNKYTIVGHGSSTRLSIAKSKAMLSAKSDLTKTLNVKSIIIKSNKIIKEDITPSDDNIYRVIVVVEFTIQDPTTKNVQPQDNQDISHHTPTEKSNIIITGDEDDL